jgi:phosphoribosylformylglycinamidine (FGAM) synthase-like enzyme
MQHCMIHFVQCDLMEFLGIEIDGGKDSLSMASKCTTEGGQSVFVKSPGTLVVSVYCGTPDVTKKSHQISKVEEIMLCC